MTQALEQVTTERPGPLGLRPWSVGGGALRFDTDKEPRPRSKIYSLGDLLTGLMEANEKS
jgi:hypothetical protein